MSYARTSPGRAPHAAARKAPRSSLAFQDVREVDTRAAQAQKYNAIWRRAVGRLWRDGGLAFHHAAEEQEPGGEKE